MVCLHALAHCSGLIRNYIISGLGRVVVRGSESDGVTQQGTWDVEWSEVKLERPSWPGTGHMNLVSGLRVLDTF